MFSCPEMEEKRNLNGKERKGRIVWIKAKEEAPAT